MQLEINKAASAAKSAVATVDMALINAHAMKELTPEEVFTFKVEACNDLVDRDFERFPLETLEALAPMYVGRTVIADHCWSAAKQQARIYKTYVERKENRNALMVECYMLRTDSTKDAIAAIEGGILREVSVGCAVGKAVCSICGEDFGQCAHQKGAVYDGEMCVCELKDPVDAYEMSFVAVPAQPGAGVTKGVRNNGWSPAALAVEKAQLEIESERWRFT